MPAATDLAALTQLAIPAVRAAAAACRAVQADLITEDTIQKKDKSPVTVADFASQAIICGYLGAVDPDTLIIGEEDAAELRDDANALVRQAVTRHVAQGATTQPAVADALGGPSATSDEQAVLAWIDRGGAEAVKGGRYWTLDPIDGTKGFLRKEQYAIALGLIDNGQVVFGIQACPNLPTRDGKAAGVLIVAAHGQGAVEIPLDSDAVTGSTISVTPGADPAELRFCESVESGHSDQSSSAQIARLLGITAEPVRMDSQAKYAAVARGDAAIYLRLPTRPGYEEKIWDHAAGMIGAIEAGGRVTDIEGKPLDFSHGRTLAHNRGVVATNGAVHDAVIDAIQKVMG